jgi:hypothetical protein
VTLIAFITKIERNAKEKAWSDKQSWMNLFEGHLSQQTTSFLIIDSTSPLNDRKISVLSI